MLYHTWSYRITIDENPIPLTDLCIELSLFTSFLDISRCFAFLDISRCFAFFLQLFILYVWLRITDEGSVPEMRIWSISLIYSDKKWCIHLSTSLYLKFSLKHCLKKNRSSRFNTIPKADLYQLIQLRGCVKIKSMDLFNIHREVTFSPHIWP